MAATAGTPSTVDTRTLLLEDVTAVGILSAPPGLGATIAGERPDGGGPGPKVHVDPRVG